MRTWHLRALAIAAHDVTQHVHAVHRIELTETPDRVLLHEVVVGGLRDRLIQQPRRLPVRPFASVAAASGFKNHSAPSISLPRLNHSAAFG